MKLSYNVHVSVCVRQINDILWRIKEPLTGLNIPSLFPPVCLSVSPIGLVVCRVSEDQ